MSQKVRKKWKPALLRKREAPPDAATRADVVRALTRRIDEANQHLKGPSNRWRDRQTIRSLEQAINERGEILLLLCAEQPRTWQTLCAELGLEVPEPTIPT